MERNLSNDDGGSNHQVHSDQVALLRYAATHPRDAECHAHSLVAVPGRRYGLNRRSLEEVRKRVQNATLEALSHDAQSDAWVAQRVAEAAERAIFAVGVERML